jgi:hypothetical protein
MTAETLEVLTLDVLDLPASVAAASAAGDKAPGVCASPGCTNGVPKPAGGRGRPPKFCDEHKGGKAAPKQEGFNSAKSPLSGKSWPRAAEVETLLTQYVNGLGIALSFVHEKDGQVIVQGGPDVVHELVELAKDERELRKYLEWLTTPGKYAPLTLAVAGVAIPLLSNHGLIQIDLSKILGPRGGGSK